MKTINSIDDLRNERIRLKAELQLTENAIKKDFEKITTELRPIRMIIKTISNLVQSDDGIFKQGIGTGIDLLIRDTILSKAGWITKTIVPFILKNLTMNLIDDKKGNILSGIKQLIRKYRRKTHFSHNGHYDNSTAHTQY